MWVELLGFTGKPGNFFLTTQERKDCEKSGLEVKLTIDSIYEDSTIQVPMAWAVDHLSISECSIPRDHDVFKLTTKRLECSSDAMPLKRPWRSGHDNSDNNREI